MDALLANRSWPPSCSHGTYQHKAITSRSRQLLMMGTWLPETCWATSRREVESLLANRSWPPSCSHVTYQHEAVILRSHQLLMMGTWLPETCWTTSRREIKDTKVTSRWFFLCTLNYDWDGAYVNDFPSELKTSTWSKWSSLLKRH